MTSASNSPEALEPCPFCGGASTDYSGPQRIFQLKDLSRCKIRCPSCGGTTAEHPTEAEAIAAWNRRPQITALSERLAVAREALRIGEQFLDKANALANGEYRGSVEVLGRRFAEVRGGLLAALTDADQAQDQAGEGSDV